MAIDYRDLPPHVRAALGCATPTKPPRRPRGTGKVGAAKREACADLNREPIVLTLPYPPSANRYWRHNRGVTHLSSEARQFRKCVAAMAADVRPFGGNVAVSLLVYRPAKRGDLDNSIKVLLDALRGYAYHDDKQVTALDAWRFDDRERPRVEVRVSAAAPLPAGIGGGR